MAMEGEGAAHRRLRRLSSSSAASPASTPGQGFIGGSPTDEDVLFDADGNLLQRSPRSRSAAVVRRSLSGRLGSLSLERASQVGSVGPAGIHLSTAAAAAMSKTRAMDAKYVEKDVDGHYLCDSRRYSGFTYMLNHPVSELGQNLREELFPELTYALESVLQELVNEQLEKEMKSRRSQMNVLGIQPSVGFSATLEAATPTSGHSNLSRHRSWRQHPTYPTQQIRNPKVHPILMLAKELKQRTKQAKIDGTYPSMLSSVPRPVVIGDSAETPTEQAIQPAIQVDSSAKVVESDGETVSDREDEDDDVGSNSTRTHPPHSPIIVTDASGKVDNRGPPGQQSTAAAGLSQSGSTGGGGATVYDRALNQTATFQASASQ